MKLLVGLGNPGEQYAHTRHNIGWDVIDEIASCKNAALADKTKWKCQLAEFQAGAEKVLLIKPTGYYNLSGESVQSVTAFYKIPPDNILIIHDELALPVGTMRTRRGGSDAGNNGVKSISSRVGEATARLRIGTHGDTRISATDVDYVLSPFTSQERKIMKSLLVTIRQIVDGFIGNDFPETTYRHGE